MHFILTNVARRDKVLAALCKVAGGKIKSDWNGVNIPCIVGNDRGMDEIQRVCNKKKIPYLYIDHAYFNRAPQMEWFRLCVSNYHCNDWRDADRDAKPKIKGWRTGGETVVVIQPAEKVWDIYPVKEWFESVMDTLPKYSDRKIVVKKKGEGALNDVLTKAFCAVTFGSVADVDTVRLGVPVFCGDKSPAFPVGLQDLSLIETPSRPDRSQWLRSLSSAEWHLDEVNLAWDRVKCLLQPIPTCNKP